LERARSIPNPLPPATAGELIIIAEESAAAATPTALLLLGLFVHPLPFDFGTLRPRRTVLRDLMPHPSSHFIGAGLQLLRESEVIRTVRRALADFAVPMMAIMAGGMPSVSPILPIRFVRCFEPSLMPEGVVLEPLRAWRSGLPIEPRGHLV
jgi:hypothetical protein